MTLDIGNNETIELPNRTNLIGGLKITHKFSDPDTHPYDQHEWERRNIAIYDFKKKRNAYERDNVEVPKHWAENASQTTVSKYLFGNQEGTPEYEDSLKHVFDRIANAYTVYGWKNGYFLDSDSAKAFNWEIKAMLVKQIWAPNSPVWFNMGHWEQWRWGRPDLRQKLSNNGNKAFKATNEDGTLKVLDLNNTFEFPQASACFLTGVDDSMEAILQHQIAEGRIFASGSGVGINLSSLRSSFEPISGKGQSSGGISFDRGWDKTAGAIKSGGKTRRAARMVLMDSDHPDVFEFIKLKNEQEKIAKVILREHNTHVELLRLSKDREVNGTPAEKVAAKFILSLPLVTEEEYPGNMDGLIYGETVSNQNANHSVSLKGDFWDAIYSGGNYSTRWVTKRDNIVSTFRAAELLDLMAQAVYENAEPGCHNNDWINLWSPYKAIERLTTSNPCITGDSLISTKGLSSIQTLVGQKPIVRGTDNKLSRSTAVFETGTKPVYRLETASGYHLDITKDHLVSTTEGDIAVQDLTPQHKLIIQGAEFGTTTVGKEIAYLAGYAVGDGCTTVTPTQRMLVWTFGNDEKAHANKLLKSVNTLKSASRTHDGRVDTDNKLVPTETGWRVNTSRFSIVKPIEKLAVLDQGSGGKELTGALSLNKADTAALLSGLFDADGTVGDYSDKSQYISLDSISAKLLEQVQILLLSFGIKSKLYRNRKKDKTALLPDGKGGLKEYIIQEIHSLRISRSSRVIFEKEINFRNPQKRIKLKKMNARVTTYKDHMVDAVKTVKYIGISKVYDLTEPATNHFTANGLLIHNCSEYIAPVNTSCNLSSFNVYRFLDKATGTIKADLLEHGALLAMIVADLNIEEGGFPIPEIAKGTYEYRTTGIGFGNIGGLLMALGIPYDSDEGRWLAGTLTSFLTAACWKASYSMGREFGTYLRYEDTKDDLKKVINLHQAATTLLAQIPEIKLEDVEKAISDTTHPNLPTWGTLNGKQALRALAKSFELNTKWDKNMMKATNGLISQTTKLWEEVIAESNSAAPRNSFVSLYAPGGCLVENSMVLTEKGLKRIRRMGNPEGAQWQPIRTMVQTDEGPKLANQYFLNGKAQTRIIRTDRMHEIQGTEKHQIKKLNPATLELEWVKMGEAQTNEILAIRLGGMFGLPQTVWLPKLPCLHGNNKVGVRIPEVMSKDLAEFLGLFCGDGSLHSKSVRIACTLQDPDLIDYVCQLGKKLFGITGIVQPKEEGHLSVSVDFISTPLANWMAACGFQKHPNREGRISKKPFIPDAVLDTNDPYVYGAFLRGLAEADGTLKYNNLPSITSHHRQFAQEVMTLMSTLGIAASMDDTSTSGLSGQPQYRVRIRNHDYLPTWVKYCGFLSDRKKAREANQKARSYSRNDLIYIAPLWLKKAKQETRNKSRLACGIRKGQITKNTAREIIKIEKNSQLGKKLTALLDYVFDPIMENIEGGIVSTYDLSVPENVTYLANGFVSHNTISAPLGIYDEGTTSAEPDYTLVKYKSLSGGGMLRMFNRLALEGLKSQGYSEWHIREAALEVAGLNGLFVACGGNAQTAAYHLNKSFQQKDAGPVRIELTGLLIEDTHKLMINVSSNKAEEVPIDILNGSGHVEKIPWLHEKHKSIFDCAATAKGGVRAIRPSGHIRMLGALQPFISGATSKTVNLPHYATVEEIKECFLEAHAMGVKCIALYRDGSKGVSVYQSDTPEGQKWAVQNIWKELVQSVEGTTAALIAEASIPKRRKLEGRRWSQVVKFQISGSTQMEGFLIVGIYQDGTCGEVFGKLGQGGSFGHGMFESFCKAFSVMLQWGVPFNQATATFKHTAFDPSGWAQVYDPDSEDGKTDIRSCKSVVDLMMKILEWLFPKETGYKIRGLQTSQVHLGDAQVITEKALALPAPSEKQVTEDEIEISYGSAEMCPECHGLTMIQDGKCKRCLNCGAGGGCGG